MFYDLYDIYILIIYYSKYTGSKIDKFRQISTKLLYSTQNIQDPKTKLFLYYLFRSCTLLKIAKVNNKNVQKM